jgi:hypothetical protein
VADDTSQEHSIDDTIRGRPGAVGRQDSDTGQHEGEAVVDRAESSDQTERVAVSYKE